MGVENISIKSVWAIDAKVISDPCTVSNGGISGPNMGRAMMIIRAKVSTSSCRSLTRLKIIQRIGG